MSDTFGTPISRFIGRYNFLSNFFPVIVTLDGCTYPSVEHAYQAAKFAVLSPERIKLRDPWMKASTAKRMGKGKAPADWQSRNLDIMLNLLRQKFSNHKELGVQLLSTGSEQLIEGNGWHDVFYGVCNGDCQRGPHKPFGDNQLGRLLMKVREELQSKA